MPNVMAAQPNIDGAVCKSSLILFLVPRRKVWLTAAALVPCSNAQGCSGAGTRGNAVPIDIFVWERRSHRHFCTSGNGVPTPSVCILTAILKIIPNALAQR